MFKVYKYLQQKIQRVQLELSVKLEEALREPYSSKLFFFNVAMMNFRLFFWQILIDTYKLVVITFADPGNSFNLIFRQQELKSCPFSYDNFKQVRAKVRMFSLSGATAMVIVGVTASLITNFLFGGKNPTQAATFGWTQGSWMTASTTAKASHTTNQAGWNYFYFKDANVSIAGGLSLSTASTTWFQSSSADFSGSITSNAVATSGFVKLLRPMGGSGCTMDSECMGSPEGWCNAGVCLNPWITYSCTTTLASDLSNGRNTLAVYRKNYDSNLYIWKTSNTSCVSPQCSGGVLVDPTINPGVSFAEYPPQAACKAHGGRLPTKEELTCLYSNRANYGNNLDTDYLSATEFNASSVWQLYSGSITTFTKNYSRWVRCVKGI